ncbi:hypothetical protein NQ317_013372 [Molorchus minor]|uniref:CRAL-TRIO domain-containing protein n=1 Tax=Molorchus minor TaxID=1323400 RepID=A0ABQ9J1E7_9CUCU|nr:hypothetical protein NQ317_013372 [Molorchus minor]
MELQYQFTPDQIISEGRTTQKNINTIKTWLSNLHDKDIPKIQDEVVVLFLLSCLNDIDLTKRTVISYYKCKKAGPEIYDDRIVDRRDIRTALNTIHMSSIPVRTDENYVVHYFKVNDTNYRNFELVPIMKISYMIMDITQLRNPPSGLIVVIDMKGVGLMHLTKFKLGAVKKYFHFLQEGFPMNLKVIHILNSVYFMDKIMALIGVFMKNELMSMLHMHPPGLDNEKLFELIPKSVCQKNMGAIYPRKKSFMR